MGFFVHNSEEMQRIVWQCCEKNFHFILPISVEQSFLAFTFLKSKKQKDQNQIDTEFCLILAMFIHKCMN